MKIAVTCVNGEVFQHFGHCPSFLVCTVENNKITSKEMLDTQGHGCSKLASFLSSHNINIVICGGIGAGAKEHIISAGMQVLPGVSGNALLQVEKHIAGTLNFDPNTQCHHHDENHQCK